MLTLPPLLTAGARFLVAGLILLAVAALRGELREAARPLAGSAVTGILLFAGGNGAVVLAETRISSGLAALLVAASPLLVALLTLAFFREPVRPLQAAGIVIGLAGLFVLARPTGSDRLDLLGVGFGLASAVLWSLGSVFGSRAALARSDVLNTAVQLLAGGASLLVLGFGLGEPGRMHLERASAESVGALVYLVLFGSLLAFSAYTWLLRNAPLNLIFTYVYVNPVIAVALGALVLGEAIQLREVAGGAIILAGVGAIVTGQARTRRAGAAA